MKGLLLVTVVCVVLVLTTGCIPPTPPTETLAPEETPSIPTSERVQARVVTVVDGDTIEVDIAGRLHRVRYIGIDTPEIGEPGAAEATWLNTQLVSGKVVELEKDVSETDRYGRLLRYVWADGTMVNAVLVARGYAQVATYPPDVEYQQEFLELQRQAREAGLGLWATAEPAPSSQGLYVGSANSNKYHYSSCRYAKQILPQNEIWFSSAAEAQAMGYVPCKGCRPPTSD